MDMHSDVRKHNRSRSICARTGQGRCTYHPRKRPHPIRLPGRYVSVCLGLRTKLEDAQVTSSIKALKSMSMDQRHQGLAVTEVTITVRFRTGVRAGDHELASITTQGRRSWRKHTHRHDETCHRGVAQTIVERLFRDKAYFQSFFASLPS